MEPRYDIYLYQVDNPDAMVKVVGVSDDEARQIADDWWGRNDLNDCVVLPEGDDQSINDGAVITEAYFDNLEEVLAKW